MSWPWGLHTCQMLSSNTVIVIVIATSTSTILCDAWEVLEEEIIVDCASVVLFEGIWDNRRREKSHKGKDNLSMAGCSDMYTFAVCMGPMALADLGKMIVTKE